MNSTQQKAGYCIWLLLTMLWSGCASDSKSENQTTRPLVAPDYKLSSDRKAFEDMRKEIPQEKRNENDELAFMMQLMGEVKRPPSEIRDKFYSAVSKKREKFNKDIDKKREEFVRKERMDREDFSKSLENERKDFANQKANSDQRRAFYDSHDQKRKDFYSAQREKRDEFEADIRDQRKNFDDYIREKTSEFTQEHRAYTKKYDDWVKEKNQSTPQSPSKSMNQSPNQKLDIEKEYEAIDRKKAQPLGTDE